MRVAAAVLALALLAPLAGCIGGGEAPTSALAEPGEDANATATNATLPDGRGESAGLKETNRTEEGVGGVEHRHDYWEGREEAVLLDEDIGFSPFPLFPDGPGSQAKSVAYVKLPNGSLVYEGAARVTVEVSAPHVAAGVERPNPPRVFLQWRTAADADWREPQEVAYGEPFEILVGPRETDMPHSTSSLWVFRLTTDRADDMLTRLRIVAYRGAAVVDWPGHPDFYADTTHRIALQQHVTTHMPGGFESIFLYDQGGTWVAPEKLISWGTTRLVVFLNVTRATNAYNAEPAGYFLETHNATVIGPEILYGDRWSDPAPQDPKRYVFEVPVDEAGMDGPYQPASRWGFRAMATYAAAGLCPGCFAYDIEYDITVIAVQDPPEEAAGA